MRIAYVVYPDFTALDLVGPYEITSRWPDVDYADHHRAHMHFPTAV